MGRVHLARKIEKFTMAMDGSHLFANDRVVLGVAWAQGGRDYMQDAFGINLNTETKDGEVDFFGVFDGHGPNGENISRFVALKLCDMVVSRYNKNNPGFPQAIETSCLVLDEKIRNTKELMDENGVVLGGSTTCVVWVKDKEIFSCNVGDSRFILAYSGKAVAVTEDHKPTLNSERGRIYKAGGHVSDARVNGILGVGRSFGDFMFKMQKNRGPHEQLVSCLPDVRTVEIDDRIDFMVIASDGIWDMLTNQQVVNFIIKRMQKTVPLNEICEQLIDSCRIPIDPFTGLGADNMTVIIAVLRQ